MIQKVQLTKSRQDVAVDIVSLAVFATMMYFIMNPEAYNGVCNAVQQRIDKLAHRLSVWQTKLDIRRLPETDD